MNSKTSQYKFPLPPPPSGTPPARGENAGCPEWLHERSKCLLRNLRNLRETKKLLCEASRDTWILTYPLRTCGARLAPSELGGVPPLGGEGVISGGHCGMSRMVARAKQVPSAKSAESVWDKNICEKDTWDTWRKFNLTTGRTDFFTQDNIKSKSSYDLSRNKTV